MVKGKQKRTRQKCCAACTLLAGDPHAIRRWPGAGCCRMFAVAHDYRLQREDRGFMCAVEIEIGAGFPTPEKFLFQHVLSKPNAQRTMLGAKRWTAQDAYVHHNVVATMIVCLPGTAG